MCRAQKLPNKTHFQDLKARQRRSGNGDVQRLYRDDQEGQENQAGKLELAKISVEKIINFLRKAIENVYGMVREIEMLN